MSPTLDLASALAATAGAKEGFDTHEEDEALFRRANEEERSLVNGLNNALRVARLHDLRHQLTQQALQAFCERIQAFLKKPRVREIMIVHADVRILVNGALIKQRRLGRSWVNDWLELVAKLGIGAFVFRGEWSREACTVLLQIIASVKGSDPEEVRKQIAAELAEKVKEPAQVRVLTIEEAAEHAESRVGEELPPTDRAIFFYARLAALTEGSLAAVRLGRSPDYQVRQVRSTLMQIIESLRTGLFEVRLLALTALPHDRAEPGSSHLTNAAILSMAMGRLLGLRRGYLIDLGFAANYHDLGRPLLGREALFQHGGRELDQSDTPTLWGVGCALRARSFGSGSLLRVAVAQEVERVAAARPGSAGLRDPHVFSKIVAVASSYGRLCNGTPWSPPLGPSEALSRLERDDRFPRDVVKLLRDVLGPRPAGTVLVLPSGETGVVIDGGARRKGKCVVRIVQQAGGAEARRLLLREVPPGEGRALAAPQVRVDWARVLLK